MRTLDLAAAAWTLCAAGDLSAVPEAICDAGEVPATVPGCVHTDLMAAGLLDDPDLADNELRQLWVGRTDWRYTCTFDLPADLAAEHVEFACDGLDTLATLALNGRPIGTSDNMHVACRFDARPALRAGSNTLVIDFAAPVTEAERLATGPYAGYPRNGGPCGKPLPHNLPPQDGLQHGLGLGPDRHDQRRVAADPAGGVGHGPPRPRPADRSRGDGRARRAGRDRRRGRPPAGRHGAAARPRLRRYDRQRRRRAADLHDRPPRPLVAARPRPGQPLHARRLAAGRPVTLAPRRPADGRNRHDARRRPGPPGPAGRGQARRADAPRRQQQADLRQGGQLDPGRPLPAPRDGRAVPTPRARGDGRAHEPAPRLGRRAIRGRGLLRGVR